MEMEEELSCKMMIPTNSNISPLSPRLVALYGKGGIWILHISLATAFRPPRYCMGTLVHSSLPLSNSCGFITPDYLLWQLQRQQSKPTGNKEASSPCGNSDGDFM